MTLRLWCIAAFLVLATAGHAAEPSERAIERLRIHGIGSSEAAIAAFLNSGFSTQADYGRMPSEPEEKTQLLIDAMQVAGVEKMAPAYEPLHRLARKQLAAGIQAMLQHDLLLAPPARRSERREEILRFLQYNAAVALSLLGDARALPLMNSLYGAAEDPMVKAQYALGMACLGDPRGMDFLMSQIMRANQASSVAAAQAMFYISGMDLGLRPTSPVQLRRKLAGDYRQWWEENREDFRLDPPAIIRRRLAPPVIPRLSMNSVRDMVAMTTNYADFTDEYGKWSAGERLDSLGMTIADDLETIAKDPMEDLLVRSEALVRYTRLKRDDAKKLLKSLEKDENPEIAAKAKDGLKLIESGRIDDYSSATHVTADQETASRESE